MLLEGLLNNRYRHLLLLRGGDVYLMVVCCFLGVFLVTCSNPAPTLKPNATATSVSSHATATATAVNANPYAPHQGTLALDDPLSANNKGYQWSENEPYCAFELDGYHADVPNIGFYVYCPAMSTDYSNLAFEAQMRIIKGDGAGGLVFRCSQTTSQYHFYAFYISQYGFYLLYKLNGSSFTTLTSLKSSANPAINQGLDQINLIAVVAQGSTLKLYVNHHLINQVTDNALSHGQIGFIATPYKQPTEVVFSNARVWML